MQFVLGAGVFFVGVLIGASIVHVSFNKILDPSGSKRDVETFKNN